MSLAPGVRLGPYEIVGLVGAGGLGEVYRARDVRLDRIVALKLLNTERQQTSFDEAQLRREARTIGSLAHPRICALHDVAEHEGRPFLIMEFIEGETLAERLVRGRLPVAEAVEYAVQILDALHHAHRRGIVHGDLKPSNVMVASGGIKLLDFGLAALRAPSRSLDEPPLTSTATAQKQFEGTVPYMAPEQLEVGAVGEQTDMFAFGATFFEMLTGRRAFDAATPASTIAAILEREPVWPPSADVDVPEALKVLVTTCLAKNADRRWQTARDVELQLRNLLGRSSSRESPGAALSAGTRATLFAVTATAVLGAITAWYVTLETGVRPNRMSFFIEPPPQSAFASASISSDGRQVAFFRVDADGAPELWARPLDSLNARRLEEARGASWNFWSPDAKALGFFAEGRLKTIRISGGPAQDLVSASEAFGGSWGRDGTIIYAPAAHGGLYRISSSGGQPSHLTEPAARTGEISHRWPHFLPDGRRFLYLSWHSEPERRALYVGFLDGQPPKRLASIESAAVFAAPGYLLWTARGSLLARPFDLERLEFVGDAEVVASDVNHSTNAGWIAVSASDDGTLVYHSRLRSVTQPTWFSREGRRISAAAPEGSYGDLALAPDQMRVALRAKTPEGPEGVWQLDLRRGILSKLAAEVPSAAPIWSPDSSSIVFAKDHQGAFRLFRKPSNGGNEEPLIPGDMTRTPFAGKQLPSDWSSDGRVVLYEEGGDIWIVPSAKGTPPRLLVHGPAEEVEGRLSPDRKWVAFSSDTSKRREVYVASVSNPERRWQISAQGGHDPRWRGDGGEIFYVAADATLMAVRLQKQGEMLQAATPAALFRLSVEPLQTRTFAAAPDGQRFLVNHLVQAEVLRTTIVLNWAPR